MASLDGFDGAHGEGLPAVGTKRQVKIAPLGPYLGPAPVPVGANLVRHGSHMWYPPLATYQQVAELLSEHV